MTSGEARAFADDWAAAWNERAVERILAHFDDAVTFTSPTAAAVVGAARIEGKPALRDYWTTALARISALQFDVDRVLWDAGARELAIIYRSTINSQSRRVSEDLRFGANGLVDRAEVFHGAAE